MPRGRKEIFAVGRYGSGRSVGRFLIGAVLLAIFWAPPCRANLGDYLQLPQIFPEHDLVVVEGERPDWKKDWDNGRRLVRSGEYREAAECYRRLLAIRGNVEEARWELALILARLEEWDKAKTELELLAETSPDNIDYLNVLGLALRRTNQAGRALDIFSKVRERSPDNFTALVGEAQGLFEAGRKREALPLFQAVAAKNPDDRDLSLSLISVACELGQLETARKYLVPLAASRKVDLDILVQAARVHDGLGREKEGAVYWEKVLGLDPGNREARERLLRYYEDLGQQDKVLLHLQALWENDPKNIALLGRICRIYSKSALVTEGLPLFEKYLQQRPDDLDFIRSIVNIKTAPDEAQVAFLRRLLAVTPDGLGTLHILATEMVATGNFAEALALWERVARVAPARVEVFRALEELLAKLGLEARLLEVLEIIHKLAPDDQAVISRLAHLRVGRGELQAGLDYYNLLEQTGYGGSDLYDERSALNEVLRRPSQALADYEKLLAISPERDDIRSRAMSLAGELGEVPVLVRLAVALEKVEALTERSRQMLLLAESFAQARDSERASRYYQLVMTTLEAAKAGGRDDPGDGALSALVHQARLGLADLYRRDGAVFEAEQLLREGLLAEVGQGEILSRLFELALAAATPDLEGAVVWLEQYGRQPQVHPGRLLIMQARLLAASGEYLPAERRLRGLLAEMAAAGNLVAKVDVQVFRQAGLSLAEILLAAGEAPAAEQQCLSMMQGQTDREVLVLLAKIYVGVGEARAADKILQQLVDPEEDSLRLLELAELCRHRGLVRWQSLVADRIGSRWPGVYRTGLLKVEALRQEGEISTALEVSEALAEKFPDLAAVIALKAQINFQGGFYRQAIKDCEQVLTSHPGRLDLQLLRVKSEMALANPAAAARLVEELYPLAGGQYLKKIFAAAGLPLPTPRHKRSLWQTLTFRSEPFFDLVGEVLSARAFFDPAAERRRINELVAPELARLRWEKSFRAALIGSGDLAQGEGKLAKKK
ncbi:MAG: tetratricopeptide repeat protein [Desulfobulbaceae bacterium]|nr:tetratricopeptide repeat protein [Desulfobulbaceae bacterium]